MLMDPVDQIPVDFELADDDRGKVNPAGAQLTKRHGLLARASQPLEHPQLLGFDKRHLPDCRVLQRLAQQTYATRVKPAFACGCDRHRQIERFLTCALGVGEII